MRAFSFFASLALAGVAYPQVASASGITYDCDTASQHFSELVLPAPSGSFTVTGNLQLRTIAEVKKWAPLGRLDIGSAFQPGSSPDVFAGFSMIALPIDKRKSPTGEDVIQALKFTNRGKEDEMLPFSMLAKPGTVQPFKLIYSGSEVTVILGSETRTYQLKTAEPVVRVICSTGEFLFTELEIKPMP